MNIKLPESTRKTKLVNFRVTEANLSRFKTFCDNEGLSQAEVMRNLLESFISPLNSKNE